MYSIINERVIMASWLDSADKGNTKYSEKNCSSSTLSTTDPK